MNNSIGQFIAALRKANGLTQQEVADRLNISNKSVSRWERGECAPDLSLIPALAEMFDVTCDELLKGERINQSRQPEKSEQRIAKQIQTLVSRSISGFKNLIFISIALSVTGLICMFGISYGFYRPVIGFFVMLLFETSAFIIAVISINKIKETMANNELLENADDLPTEKVNKSIGTYSFTAFFLIFSVILLSLPLVIFTSEYVNGVLFFGSWLLLFLPPIALMLALVFIKAKKPFIAWITGQSYAKANDVRNSKVRLMTSLQLGMLVLAGILFIAAPHFDTEYSLTPSPLYIGLIITGLVLIIGNIACFIIFMLKYKELKKKLLLPGIRNMLMISSVLFLSNAFIIHFYNDIEITDLIPSIWLSIVLALLIAVVFSVIEHIMSKKEKK